MSGSARSGGDGPQREDVQILAVKAIDLLLDGRRQYQRPGQDSRTHTAKMVAYIQGRDHEGQTALFAAAESGWDKVTKRLLERGADPTLRDAAGKTALDYARAPRPSGAGAPAPSKTEPADRVATVALLTALVQNPQARAGAASPGSTPATSGSLKVS